MSVRELVCYYVPVDKHLGYAVNVSNYTIIGQIQDALIPEEKENDAIWGKKRGVFAHFVTHKFAGVWPFGHFSHAQLHACHAWEK